MENNIDVATKQVSGIHLKDEHEADDEGPSEGDRERFNQLVSKAKKYVGEGRIEEGLRLNQKALQIFYHEKLAKKIKKMEEYLKAHADDSDDDDEDESGMMHLGKGFYVYKDLYKKLYSHQQEGVLWLWSLFRRKKGGILGDDMGLGKTIQVIAFLSGMFDMQKIRSVLIILPVALMVNWEKEAEKWAPGLKVVAYHGNSKREKERALARVQNRGGICLTTYGLVVTSSEQLGTRDGREFVWDYMILDEGHKIKNPTKTSKGVHAIPAHNRVILTGTPVQNNLKELWALFDFVHQGSLLGTQRTFKMEYDNPITRAREKDATVGEKKLGMEMAESLKKIIAPYFLRRTKAEVKEREKKEEGKDPNQEEHAVMPTMTRKNDLIVWTFLTDTQLKIYQDFLSLDSVKELLMTTKSPLVALNVLKKICDHPRLLSTRACVQLGIDGDDGLDDDFLETEAGNLSAVTRIQHVDDNILVHEAGKLTFLVQLLGRLKEEGHRCLVFSQSRKMLDIMEKVLTNRGHKIMRLDGTIAQVQEREQRIRKFQTDDSYSVFLLTTQVGGVGLTLTAADRVVIYDPSWNPATDAQAVDRVFRIGQDKNVVIYRLITCGTVEEKIYRRQVFKDSITKQTTGAAKNPYRYFSKYELKELFTMDDPHTSTTQQQLEQMHGGQRCTDTHLDEHIAFLYSLDMYGISDHDLMFSQGSEGGDDQDQDNGDDDQQCPEDNYIQHRVQKAQELIQMESSQTTTLDERLGKSQPAGGGGGGFGGGGSRNWDFPKSEPRLDDSPVKQEVNVSPQSQSPAARRPVQVDLTSPQQHSRINSEDGTDTDASSCSVDDENSSVDRSVDSPQIKQEVVDLTSPPVARQTVNGLINTPNVKAEPLDQSSSPHIKAEPINSPYMKGEPADLAHIQGERVDLTSTPYSSSMQTEVSNSNRRMSDDRLSHRKQNISTNLFGCVDSPEMVQASKSTDISPGSVSSNTSGNSSRHVVEDSPNSSVVKSFYSNRTASNKADSSINESVASEGLIEESMVINDSVIISDGEENEVEQSGTRGNISVHEIRSILEKSLCSNAGEFNKSHASSAHDSPVVAKTKRRSVCVRRVIESSDEEDDEPEAEDLGDNASVEEDVEENEQPESDNNSEHEESVQESEENLEESLHEDIPQEYLDSVETNHNANDTGTNDIVASEHVETEDEVRERVSNNTVDVEGEHVETEEDVRERMANNTIDMEGGHVETEEEVRERMANNTVDVEGEYVETEEEVRERMANNTIDMEGEHVETEEEVRERMANNTIDMEDEHVETEEEVQERVANNTVDMEGEYEEEGEGEETEEDTAGFDSLIVEEQIRYNELVEAGRLYCSSRQYEEAQVCVLQALEIFPDEELQATSVSIQKKILKHQRKTQLEQQRGQQLIG